MKTIRVLYLILANTLVLFACALLAIHGLLLFYYHDWESSEDVHQSLPEVVKKNYAHMSAADVETLLNAPADDEYAPWVGWRSALLKWRFVNIDENGIRGNGKPVAGLERIQDAVWFFGGSTTWGVGVTDAETIPARLEEIARRPVVNFGVHGFYSEQENLLLVQFLRLGYRPSEVIFLDGINEHCKSLPYADEMKALFARNQPDNLYRWDLRDFAKPVVHAYGKLVARLKRVNWGTADDFVWGKLVCERSGRTLSLGTIHAQVLAERDSLCRLYKLRCTTFVQPFAGMHGRHEDPTTLLEKERGILKAKFDHLKANWRAANSVFVTNALDRLERHAYIDNVHYSAEASSLIAKAIADHLARAGVR